MKNFYVGTKVKVVTCLVHFPCRHKGKVVTITAQLGNLNEAGYLYKTNTGENFRNKEVKVFRDYPKECVDRLEFNLRQLQLNLLETKQELDVLKVLLSEDDNV